MTLKIQKRTVEIVFRSSVLGFDNAHHQGYYTVQYINVCVVLYYNVQCSINISQNGNFVLKAQYS